MPSSISRRAALAAGVAASAALAWSSQQAAAAAMPWKPIIGLNGFASVWGSAPTMLWEALEYAASLGFVGVELVTGWPPGFSYPDPADARRVDALRRLYERYGLGILAVQTAPPGRGFSPDASERAAWLAGITRQFELVRALGGTVAGHWPGGDFGNQSATQALAHMVDSCKRAADAAAKQGVTLCLEIEPVFAFNKADELVGMVHGVNHPHCKAIYDPSHFDQMNGATCRPEELLLRMGVANVGHIQFCDTDGTRRGAETSTHLACGDGKVDIARNLDILWEGGYRGTVMLDCWQIPDQFDAIRKGKRAIDSALARHGVRTKRPRS